MQPYLDYRLIGQRIRTQRSQLKITQEALAEQLGITPEHLSRIENGKTGTSLAKLAQISLHLNYPLEQLITGIIISEPETQGPSLDCLLQDCSPREREIIRQIVLLIRSLR